HTLQNDWQTPDDFLQHFGPTEIMQSLAQATVLRSKLLVKLANVHEKIAAKKSIDSATEDLRLALEEGITTAEALVEQYPADDCVRYLKGSALWNFVFEDPFYKTTHSDGDAAHARAVRRMTFIIECALDEQVLTLAQLIDGLGYESIAEHLPAEDLRKIVIAALRQGRQRESLTEQGLLDIVSLPRLVSLVPLANVWQQVLVERIAKSNGWADGEAVRSTGSGTTGSGGAAPRSNPTPESPAKSGAVEASPESPRLDSGAALPPASQDEARARAVLRLREIERLPPRQEELSTPILLSIESMYEDLLQANSDEERAECIRESFPNEAHLRTAMFALAELLEPSIDVTRPPICDADTDALVKLVVFEERKRKDGDGGLRRASVRPPPLPLGRSASSIPAARVSGPPKNER
ncbi:MAG TPA: hypothetical protein VIV60_05785, partial [Polyangiaceae bacterium]